MANAIGVIFQTLISDLVILNRVIYTLVERLREDEARIRSRHYPSS